MWPCRLMKRPEESLVKGRLSPGPSSEWTLKIRNNQVSWHHCRPTWYTNCLTRSTGTSTDIGPVPSPIPAMRATFPDINRWLKLLFLVHYLIPLQQQCSTEKIQSGTPWNICQWKLILNRLSQNLLVARQKNMALKWPTERNLWPIIIPLWVE